MASKRTNFAVGLFVLFGIVLTTVAVVWLGMSKYLEKGKFYVAYFDESVQGLREDSAVKYRGVSIGRVTTIGVAPDEKLIEVVLKIETDIVLDPEQVFAQLKNVGITGIMFVDIDRVDDTAKPPGYTVKTTRPNFENEFPVIPTRPSDILRIFDSLEAAINKVKEMDIQGITERLKLTLDEVHKAIISARLEEVSNDLRSFLKTAEDLFSNGKIETALTSISKAGDSFTGLTQNAGDTILEIKKTIVKIEKLVDETKPSLKSAITSMNSAMNKADGFFENGNTFLDKTDNKLSDLQRHLITTLRELENAADRISDLSDELSNQPSRVLFSSPPAPRTVEEEKRKKE